MDERETSSLLLNSGKVENDKNILAEECKNDYKNQIAADDPEGTILVIEDETNINILVTEDKTSNVTTNEDEYVVNKIVGQTVKNGQVLYRVHW